MKNKILAAVSAAVLSLSLFGECKPKIGHEFSPRGMRRLANGQN